MTCASYFIETLSQVREIALLFGFFPALILLYLSRFLDLVTRNSIIGAHNEALQENKLLNQKNKLRN